MRISFRNKVGKDAPFTLPATDRAQTREYFLRFDPKRSRAVVVRKGETLLPIARRAYPQLSQWAAIDALAFINNLKNPESIRPDQTLIIYDYEIVKDVRASWVTEAANKR